MFKTKIANENVIISVLLICTFILNTGTIFPMNNSTHSSNLVISNPNLTIGSPKNLNRPSFTQNSVFSSDKINPQINPYSDNKLQSSSSVTAVSIPNFNTTTIYDNGANFQPVTPSLLPFAERYRMNSSLNGWIYNNGLAPDYIPLKQLVYTHNNISSGSFINTSTIGDFPVSSLKFIPNYPVTITMYSTESNVGLSIYNSTRLAAPTVTNGTTINSITFTPNYIDSFYLKIQDFSSLKPINVTVNIQQFANPTFLEPLMTDLGTTASTYNWIFTSNITSIGLLTPPSLDLYKLLYNRSDTANIDYNNSNYTGFGIKSVYDNSSWSSLVTSYLSLTTQIGCDTFLSVEQQCQSFLPMFFYNSFNAQNLSNGMWVPSLEINHTFGANPQILTFLAYFGQHNTPQAPTEILVQDMNGKTMLNLTSSFVSTSLSTFAENVTVLLPTTTLSNGSYVLNIYQHTNKLYSYPFKVLDSLYGNYRAPIVNFGYNLMKYTNGANYPETVVYANITDIDTTVNKVVLRYSTNNVAWSIPTLMTWVDVNKWGFAIPLNISQIANVSLTIFESAPSDQGKLRLQVQAQFSPDVLDLSYNTNTTMQISLIPRGKNTSGPTQIKFLNDNTYQLVGIGGATLTNSSGYYVYNILNNVTVNTKQTASFTITPKNSGLLKVNETTISLGDTESQNIFFNVTGLLHPKVDVSFVVGSNGKLPNLYPYLNNTYPMTVKYRFIGGTPTSNFNIVASGSSGSIAMTILPVNFQEAYPLVYYQKTVDASVNKTFKGTTTIITGNITYGNNFNSTSNLISAFAPVLSAQLNDINGYLLTGVYLRLMSNLSLNLELNFFNGTPVNSISYTVSSTWGLFSTASGSVSISSIIGNSYNISLTLVPPSTYSISTDDIVISVSWDGNSFTKTQHITVDDLYNYSDLLTSQITSTSVLDITKTNYTIKGKISSVLTIPIRNISLSLNSSYDLTVVPSKLQNLVLSSKGSLSFSFVLNYNQNSNININPLNFLLVMNSPGYNTYTFSFSVQSNSQNSTQGSSSSSNNTKTTPGFELSAFLISLIIGIKKSKKYNK